MTHPREQNKYNILKENIGMLVLVPTILGGLWQVIELSSLGTPYLRFFSLSQLVSDGLLILFILAFTVLPIWWYFKDADLPSIYRKKTEEKHDDVKIQDSEKRLIYSDGKKIWISKKNGYYFLSTFTLLYAIIMVFVFWPEIIIPLLHETKTSVFGLMGFMFLIGLTLVYFRILMKTIFQIHSWKVNYEHNVVKEVTASLLMLTFLAFSFFCLYFARLFHRSFLLPENFKNQQYMICRIHRNNSDLKKISIDYFNDKYVFVSITDIKNKKYLEIFKFEDFLDNSSCQESTP